MNPVSISDRFVVDSEDTVFAQDVPISDRFVVSSEDTVFDRAKRKPVNADGGYVRVAAGFDESKVTRDKGKFATQEGDTALERGLQKLSTDASDRLDLEKNSAPFDYLDTDLVERFSDQVDGEAGINGDFPSTPTTKIDLNNTAFVAGQASISKKGIADADSKSSLAPIVLLKLDSAGTIYAVADGHHRLARQLITNRQGTVDAKVFDVSDDPEVKRQGYSASAGYVRLAAGFDESKVTRDKGQFSSYSGDTAVLEPGLHEAVHYGDIEGTLNDPDVANADTTVDAAGPDGDRGLDAIQHAQGFDGPPQDRSVDEVLASGGKELWRGEAHTGYADQFVSGDLRAGTGIYGNGTYASVGRSKADGYLENWVPGTSGSDGGAMLRMALDPNATVISYEDAMAGAIEAASTATGTKQKLVADPGRWAAAAGNDAIVTSTGEFVILNRTAVAVERVS